MLDTSALNRLCISFKRMEAFTWKTEA